MAVNIKIKVDVDKEVEKSLDNITKRLEGVSKGMDSIVKKMETGFQGIGDGLNEMLMRISDVDSMSGLKQVEQAMMLLQTAFKNNKITLEQYLPLMDKLTAKYNELSVSATKAATSTKPVGNLNQTGISQAQTGSFSQNQMKWMDVGNLQQILSISKQQLQTDGLSLSTREKIAQQLKNAQAALKNLNLTDRQRAEIADKQLRVEEKKTQQLEKQAVAARRANATDQFDYAMGMQSNTLTQIIAKTNELKTAKNNLNKSDKVQAEQIKIVNRELQQLKIKEDQVNKSGLSLVDTNNRSSSSFSELAQMAGAYFSIQGIKNFAMEMANVTGEFDLQRRSLQALLQDRQAADAIFEKIKATAIQSPFSVMQLTAATKQLAAYRIEADNLFDTTTMLSDISAGLGVEMERLILAFGQVKAATVLRGQEVRQFTEAGIPVISLLAQKFGELENRAVSTGEVFDKISNRLVPFEMINEIFQDMTSNGGVFFEMQKIQAETIKGKIVNLTDAYQIFLDKMGSANSGIIKGFIGMLEGMLKNMDSILPILKGLVAGLITYNTLLGISNLLTADSVIRVKLRNFQLALQIPLLKAGTVATTEMAAAQTALKGSMLGTLAANPYIALAAAIALVGVGIWQAQKAQKAFNKELDQIHSTGISDANKLYETYIKLVSVIKDNSKSVQEQTDAYKELERTFKDILPEQQLQLSHLQKEKIAYDEVRAAIYATIKAKTLESQSTKIFEKYSTEIDNLSKKMEELNKQTKGENINTFLFELQKNVEAAFNQNPQKIADEWANVMEILNNTSEFDTSYDPNYLINKNLFNIDDLFKKYGIRLTNNNKVLSKKIIDNIISLNKELNSVTARSFGDDSILERYGKDSAESYKKIIDHLPEIIKYYEKVWNKTSSDFDYRQQQQIKNRQQLWLQQNIDLLEKSGNPIKLKMAQDLRKELKKILGDDDQRDIKANLEKFANQFGVSLDKIRMYLKSDQQGFGEWGETINNELEQRIENLRRYKAAEDKSDINIRNLLGGSDLKAYEAETKFLLRVQKFYQLNKKDNEASANSRDPLLNAIKEEISLIEKLTNQYKLLLKEGYSIDKAKETVGVSFKENIENINKILTNEGLEPLNFEYLFQGDPNDILELYTKQLEKLEGNKEASKLLSEQIGELKVKIEIAALDETENEIKQFLEDIKRKYELSLEINDAPSLSRDVLMKMFGLNEADILNNIGQLIDKVNEKIREKLVEQGVQGTEGIEFNKLTTEQFNAFLEPFKSKEGYGDIAKGLLDLFNFLQDKQKQYIDSSVKAYQELLRKYADFNDQRTLVAENGDKELRTLDEQFATDELKRSAKYLKLKKAIANKTAKEIAAINYEELKVSDEYINMFDRIDIMSEGNMVESYGKVRDGIVDAFSKGIIKVREFKSQLAELDRQFQEFYKQTTNFGAYLQGGFDGLFKNIAETSYNLEAIAVSIEKIGDTKTEAEFREKLGIDMSTYLEKNGQDISKLWSASSGSAEKMSASLSGAAKGMSAVAAKGASAAMWVQLIVQNIYGAIKGINELRAAFSRLNESQGELVNKYTTENDKFWTALGNFNETAMSGFEQLKSGNILGALATTIRSYVDIASDFNELSDKQIQEKIEDTTDSIDRLNDSLDRLQTQVDKQLGSDWLSGMNEIAEGYGQMAEDTQANIDNMKSMKNPDEDAIYDEEQKLLDYQQKQRDIIDEMVEEMTGTDLKSAAEDFAQIWLDAFMAGDDAMGAIEERFGEMINNMIVKAIASKVVAGILQKTFTMVEEAVNDGALTPEELEAINNEGQAAMVLINEALGGMGSWFQSILGAYSSFNGETLQKGIQGVTEQTAGIIEGYLNTIRFEIFKHTNVLQGIQTQMQMNNNISSDILYQATLSYQVLVAIRDWQTSITTLDNGLPAIRVV